MAALNNSSLILEFRISAETVTGSFLVLLTTFGSVLIMLTYLSEPKIQSLTNLWIVSMSFTDLLLGVIVMPIAIISGGYPSWTFGQAFCDVFIMLDVLCCTCSIYHLCFISFDRYLCITKPLSYPRVRTRGLTFVAVFCCWTFCLMLSLPPIFGWSEKRPDEVCMISSWSYAVFSSILSFYLPLALIIFAYVAMYKQAKKQNRKAALTSRMALISRRLSRHVSRTFSTRRRNQEPEDKPTITIEYKRDETRKTGQGSDRPSQLKHMDAEAAKGGGDNRKNHKSSEREPILKNVAFTASSKVQLRVRHPSPPGSPEMSPIVSSGNFLNVPGVEEDNVSTASSDIGDGDNGTETPEPVRKHAGFYSALRLMESTNVIRKISAQAAIGRKLSRKRGFSVKTTLMKNREKQERKAGRVVAVVIVTFVTFWAPFFILNVIAGSCNNCVPGTAFGIATWMGYANSAMNPLIYSAFNVQFRRAMLMVLKCKRWKKIRASLISCR